MKMETLYQPREDSFLLWEVTKKFLDESAFPGMKILDLGTGSGFLIKNVSEFLKEKRIKAELYASELVKVELPEVNFILSDLFQNIPGKFDLILFNPPYLPADEKDSYLGEEKKNLVGGKKGNEVIKRFLEQLPKHLEEKSSCFLILSSLSHPQKVEKKALKQGFLTKKIAEKPFFFEKLFVYLIQKRN